MNDGLTLDRIYIRRPAADGVPWEEMKTACGYIFGVTERFLSICPVSVPMLEWGGGVGGQGDKDEQGSPCPQGGSLQRGVI